MDYKDWVNYRSHLAKRDVSHDTENFDLEGHFNDQNSTPIDPHYDPIKDAGKPYQGHLPDTHKLPNHPTFSTQSKYSVPGTQQGGEWLQRIPGDDNTWEFTPSKFNLQNMPPDEMQAYFNETESPEALNLPPNQRFSKLRGKLK